MAFANLGTLLTLAARSRVQTKAMLQMASGDPVEIAIGAADILPMYTLGATIAFQELHRWDEDVSSWVERLRDELGVPGEIGGCNLYLSPPDHGVPMHFDDHEVIVVQVAGKKTWRIAPNTVVTHPVHNAGRTLESPASEYADGPPPERMPPGKRVVMRPGSVLFLPRGYWHETHAPERSISLTFGFRTPSWAEVLQQHLAIELTRRPEWREAAWDAWDADGRDGAAAARWAGLRDALLASLAGRPLDQIIGGGTVRPSPRRRRVR